MRKYIKSFLIALTAIILIPAVSVLAGYTSSISVQNTGATGYDMVSVNMSANVAYWESDGFIGVNGTDVRIYRGAVEIPHMMVTDRITMALPLPAYSSQTLQFVTGETPQDFYIVPGYSSNTSVGRVHIADNPNIELGNNFSVNMTNIYLNTDNGTDKNIIRKDDAFYLFTSNTTSGDVTALIYIDRNVTITLNPDGVGTLTDIPILTGAATHWEAVSDASDVTFVANNGAAYLTDTYSCEDADYPFGVINSVTVYNRIKTSTSTKPTLYINGTEYNGNDSGYVSLSWEDKSYTWYLNPDTGLAWTWHDIIGMEIGGSVRTTNQGQMSKVWAEVNYTAYEASATLTGITSGEYDVTVSANITHLVLNIDGTSNSTALNGVSVPDNANDIYLFENNSVAYCKTFEIQRIGVQQLYYAPNDIIDGTSGILPDRGSDATDNYGVILFGSNPANIALTLGAFASDYMVSTEISQQTSEVAPEVSINTITKEDAAKIVDLSAKDPALYPLFNAINGVVGIPIMFMYQGVFLALAVGIVFVFGKFGHLTIGVVASLVVIGFATAWGVYDIVMLTILIISGIGLILMQGRQSV